jgi:exopolysaccharide/PEP-CTERM locus tyrosine autokinase
MTTGGGGNVRSTDRRSLIEKAAKRLPSGQHGGGTRPQSVEPSDTDGRQKLDTGKRSATESVAINQSTLHRNGIITSDHLKTRTTEEFRLIKRGLLNHYTQNGADRQNLVLITSAVSGEGKSFCALNIAMSIALEENFRVLLVDCDFTNSTIMRTLGIKAKKGLMDVLMDERLDLSDVLLRTDINRLSVLPPGTSHSRSAEFLGSKRMANLVNELAHRYDDRFIIFDTPPVLMKADTSVLSAHVGQIVFVIRSESTSRDTVKEALDLIADNPNINLLLNGTRETFGSHQFGQDYYQYHKQKRKLR